MAADRFSRQYVRPVTCQDVLPRAISTRLETVKPIVEEVSHRPVVGEGPAQRDVKSGFSRVTTCSGTPFRRLIRSATWLHPKYRPRVCLVGR
jgi:hypothetical protein